MIPGYNTCDPIDDLNFFFPFVKYKFIKKSAKRNQP